MTERVPKKMINTDALPGHRLNSAQKENMSSTFFPLFQSKIRHENNGAPTGVDEVVFRGARSLTPNAAKPDGIKTYDFKSNIDGVLRENDVTSLNMIEQYKSKISKGHRRASQMPPSRRKETISELLSMRSQASGGQDSSNVLNSNRKMGGNPNARVNAGNKRNLSTVFCEAVAQKQEEDNRKTQKILSLYKKMKNSQTKNKQYRAKHKNQESGDVPQIRAKRPNRLGGMQTLDSDEFQLTMALPGAGSDPKTPGIGTQRHSTQEHDGGILGRTFGVDSHSRHSSLNRNEFTAHFRSHRGQGACKDRLNLYQSHFKLN